MTDKQEPSIGGEDWQVIETSYIAGAEYSDLAITHGVKEATIRQRAKRGTWSQKRHSVSRDVTEKAISTIVNEKADLLAKLNETDLQAAEALRDKAYLMLKEAKTPNDIKSLAGVYDVAQKISRLALGASTENSTVTNKELPASVDEFV